MNTAARRAASHTLRQPRNSLCFRRWNSNTAFEQRKWSTPLARTLASAMKVIMPQLEAKGSLADIQPGHRAHPNRSIHAPSPDVPRRRVLYISNGCLRQTRRLRHITRDLAGLWRTRGYLDYCRVDGARSEEGWGAIDGGWTWEGDSDG